MNRDEWDKRIAAGRDRLEDENRREAEMINKMQNHCCLGLIALYTFGVFFAFLVSRVREYPEVQATVIHLPVEKQHQDMSDETLRDLTKNGDVSSPPSKRSKGASRSTASSSKSESDQGLSGDIEGSHNSSEAPTISPENPDSLPPPSVDTGQGDSADSRSEYADSMNGFLGSAVTNLRNIRAFGQEFMRKPDIMKDAEWNAEATGALLSLKSAAEQMANMYKVPRTMRQVNSAATDAARLCVSLDNDYAHAVTVSNVDAMKTVIGKIPAALDALHKVGTMMDAVQGHDSASN